jgi:flagellar biogenesis protein FliO
MSPLQKLGAAAALLVAFSVAVAVQSQSMVLASRILLGGAALVGGAFWYSQNKRPHRFLPTQRMQVIQRLGLSQRSAMALVDIDGHPYLIVHGEGFAKILRTIKPSTPQLVEEQVDNVTPITSGVVS